MPSPEGARSEQFSVRLSWSAAIWVRAMAKLTPQLGRPEGYMNAVIVEAVERMRLTDDGDDAAALAFRARCQEIHMPQEEAWRIARRLFMAETRKPVAREDGDT